MLHVYQPKNTPIWLTHLEFSLKGSLLLLPIVHPMSRKIPSSHLTKAMAEPWWKESVVYQIYPASFLSTNPTPEDRNAVVGDVRGIIEKVPYIASLGFDTIWLSPIFASPQKDMGYDISDYREIHSAYGTVQDVQELIDLLHSTTVPGTDRKMRLLMDLVVNHTSSEHPWFLESQTSKTNSKNDWYFWRDAKFAADGTRKEPNNWRSIFGGPAWHWVEARQQYYLALFLPEQPDLNWEQKEMREATFSDMRWWLDRGVDGFRIDSMNLMSKYPELPDAKVEFPNELYQSGAEWYASGPNMHEHLQEISREVFQKYDVFTVGELGSVEDEESVSKYVAKSRKELDCVFHGMDLDFGPGGKYTGGNPFTVQKLRDITEKWQVAMPKFDGWNTIYLDNHDSGRSLSRYTSDDPKHRANAAKMLATFICTQSGTPFVLSGQEIAMANLGKEVPVADYLDVEGRNWYAKILQERGDGADMSDVMHQLQLKARDHGRLPMQWSKTANAGFCGQGMKPWMTVNPDFEQWNVESQITDKDSVLHYWRQILRLRRDEKDVLVYGEFRMIPEAVTGTQVIAYERWSGTRKLVVFLSFATESVSISEFRYNDWKVLISNMGFSNSACGKIVLRPYESVVLCSDTAA